MYNNLSYLVLEAYTPGGSTCGQCRSASTLRAQDWSRLRTQSLLYRSQGPLGRTTLGRRYFFPPTLYPCLPLSDWMVSTISRRERIHQTTLNCNITPNISSILQRLFHGGITEAARQHEVPVAYVPNIFDQFKCQILLDLYFAVSNMQESQSVTL